VKRKLAFCLIVFITMVLPSCNQLINFPAPILAALNPTSYTAGQPASPPLEVIGNNFTPSSVVELSFNGGTPTPRTTFFTGDVHHMTATLLASDVQNPALISVTVFTPQPGGGTSTALTLTINPLPSPKPTITSIEPSGVLVGGGGFNLIVTGKGFVTRSIVTLNGNNLTTSLQNSQALLASVPSTLLVTPGVFDVTVLNPTNPPPGGGTSNIVELTVANPVPTISSLSPTSSQAGGTAPALTVTGANFVTGSQILINGTARTTTLASGTSVSTQLTAGDLAGAAINQIAVSNPSPGGGISNILPYAVTPTATSGLPALVDVDANGSQPDNAICGQTCLGTTPNLTTAGPGTSNNGEFVVFASDSSTLIGTQTIGGSNIYLRDSCLGQGSCVPTAFLQSVGVSGEAASGPSTEPSLSKGSGTFIAFTSTATNLVTNVPVNGTTRQVYWRQACTSATTTTTTGSCSSTTQAIFLVSASADGASAGNGDSFSPSISPDGRFVAFVSLATNLVSSVLVDGVTPQVYVTDTCNGVTTPTVGGCVPKTLLVSSFDGMTPGNAPSSSPALANDGLFVSFTSTATNLLGPTVTNANAFSQIYERGTCINSAVDCVGSTTLVSSPDGVTFGNGSTIQSTISQDGRFVAFASTAVNLVAGVGPVQQIFRRDTCTGQTNATCTPSIALMSTANGTDPGLAMSESPNMDPTGQFVAFASLASNFSPNAANGVENVYVRNTCTGATTTSTGTSQTCTIATALVSLPAGISPAPANGNSIVPSISGDGKSVSFISFASNLVANDRNNSPDIFLGATGF
jgi:WD40-like Beta Propeller Repeat